MTDTELISQHKRQMICTRVQLTVGQLRAFIYYSPVVRNLSDLCLKYLRDGFVPGVIRGGIIELNKNLMAF